MRALICEANHATRDSVKVALQQMEDVLVDIAEDAWALELAKENEYDMVVMAEDLGPAGDGIALLRELREGGCTGPAIVLTRGNADALSAEKEALNIAAILTVPLDTVEIFKAIVTTRDRTDTRR